MSHTSGPTTNPSSSAADYDKTFGRALKDYKKLTGQDLNTHPFALNPNNFKSTDAVLKVLQAKVEAFDDVRDGNEMLMTWLGSYVSLLFTISSTLWESPETSSSLQKTICTAIVILLEAASQVDESYDSLVELFDRLQFYLQRFDTCIDISYTPRIKQRLLSVMAEALSTLAGFTKTMKEKPIKKILMSLVGKKDVVTSNKLPRLQVMNTLTHEESLLSVSRSSEVSSGAAPIGELIRDAGGDLGVIQEDDRRVDDSDLLIQTVPRDTTKSLAHRETDRRGESRRGSMLIRDQYKEKLRQWLTPPDPQTNHNAACSSQHPGTGNWFMQSKSFRSWKKSGSSLLICGKSGSGKTILCSSVIEDVKRTRDPKSDIIAYYYFDAKDPAKCDLRGLLASLLTQLGDSSGLYLGVISQLYIRHSNGSEQPCEGVLGRLLKSLLEVQPQTSIYIIVDGVDNCPNTNTGAKSARKKVVEFLEGLVRSRLSNLYICITSSPEEDMQRCLKVLAPPTRRVSLHEQDGHMEDIKRYTTHFIQNDKDMQTWPAGDKDILFKALSEESERAGGTFRWVSHQLHTLRGRIPSQTHDIQEEVGTPLDETFKKALHDIPEEKSQYALRLFKCLVAAIRPLGLKELVDVFSTGLGTNVARNEEAVRYTCPALVSVGEKDPKIVQFSQPLKSVKEFLTSSRLRNTNHKTIKRYHFSLEDANATLSRVCISVLLRFDETADRRLLESSPLALYAAQHWVDHTQFGNVASENQDIMTTLLDRDKSHLDAWLWMHDIDKGQSRAMDDLTPKPPRRSATPLYYAALCGFGELVNYLVNMNPEDLEDGHAGYHGTPLHAASYKGHLDAVRALLDRGAKVDTTFGNKTPLHSAFHGGQLETMRLLLEKDANVDAEGPLGNTVLHHASLDGQLEFVDLLLEHNADVDAKNKNGWTPLHRAALRGRVEVAKRLLEKEAEVDTPSQNNNTPLHIASIAGKLQVVDLLLKHNANVDARGEHGWNPLEAARENRHDKIVQRLLPISSNEFRRPVFDRLRQLYPL